MAKSSKTNSTNKNVLLQKGGVLKAIKVKIGKK